MMYRWQPPMVRFMRDASEHCGYHAALAERIARYLPPGAHVCDAGCGLGYLSLELSRRCRLVTAVDIAPQALEVLRDNVARFSHGNIRVVEGDIFRCPPKTPYDAMVFNFFGKPEEALRIAKRQCAGKAVIVTRGSGEHRFSLADIPARRNTLSKTCDALDRLGIRFSAETFSLEMGQPFRCLDDAVAFFTIYNRGEAPSRIARENVTGRLVRQPSEEFPYYLPSLKPLGMIVLNAGDIPESIESFREVQSL
jgi:SAM-dependent methyltransferase